MKELWRDVVGYEGLYEVSTTGKVRNIQTGRELKGTIDQDGYKRVGIKDANGFRTKKGIHRLVADAFIDNPEGKPTVDHISQDKLDNSVENLRWATLSEQAHNRSEFNNGAVHPIIQQLDEDGNVIAEFKTYIKAVKAVIPADDERSISCLASKIRKVCKGQGRRTALGYKWRFKG